MKEMRILIRLMDKNFNSYGFFWTRCTASGNGIVTLTEGQKDFIFQKARLSVPVFTGIGINHFPYHEDMGDGCFVSHRSDIPGFLVGEKELKSWWGNTLTFSDIFCGRSYSVSTIIN